LGPRLCARTLDWERLAQTCQDKKEAMVGIMVGPNTPGINATSELIVAAKKFADAHGLIWNPHIAESADINERVQSLYGHNGVVEYLHSLGVLGANMLAAHCVHLNAGEVRLLGESGGSVVHNPVSNMFLGDGIAPVQDLLKERVKVCLGTDGACSNISQDMFEVMKAATLLQKIRYGAAALPCEQVLKMATVDAARALGLGDKIGSLEEGKMADLIILNLYDKPHAVAVHHLPATIVYGAKSTDVETVIINGRTIMESGKITSIDEKRIIRKAQSAGLELARRCPDLEVR